MNVWEKTLVDRKELIVIASSWDVAAKYFVDKYAEGGVRLMTPRDLSQSGWSYRVGDAPGSTAVIGEERILGKNVGAVLTRIPCVSIHDLPHIADDDRIYVAAEMTAFLLAWLTELDCPVINRPTPRCLSGPGWAHEKWVQTALRLGIPTSRLHRQICFSKKQSKVNILEHDGASVTVAGRKCIGTVHQGLMRAARALADASGTELLEVRFGSPESDEHFWTAHPYGDLTRPEIGEAVFQCLRRAQN